MRGLDVLVNLLDMLTTSELVIADMPDEWTGEAVRCPAWDWCPYFEECGVFEGHVGAECYLMEGG